VAHLLIDVREGLVQRLNLSQVQRQQESMLLSNLPGECSDALCDDCMQF
jgi:hypothetical protein